MQCSTRIINILDVDCDSNDKIYDHFSDNHSVFETACDLLTDTDTSQEDVYVNRLPCLKVVDMNGRLYSLSNRRLYALREYEKILTKLVGPRKIWVHASKMKVGEISAAAAAAFTTNCCGKSVELTRPCKVSFFPRHEKGSLVMDEYRVYSLSGPR